MSRAFIKRPSVALPEFNSSHYTQVRSGKGNNNIDVSGNYISTSSGSTRLSDHTRMSIRRCCWSISFILIAVLVLSLCLTGYGIWLVNYLVTRHAIHTVSIHGREALMERIRGQLSVYFGVGPRVVRTMYHEFKMADLLGLNISSHDPDNLFHSAMTKVQLLIFASLINSSHLQSVWFATPHTLNGLLRDTRFEGRTRFNVNNGYPNGTMTTQAIDIHTLERQPVSIVTRNFTSSSRPWYKKPFEAQTMRWSGTYRSVNVPFNVVLAIGVPYYDGNHDFKGILMCSFNVIDVSDFLKSIPIQQDARALVLETDLIIVGSSIAESVVPVRPGHSEKLHAENHSDYVVRETAQHIRTRYGMPVALPLNSRDEFKFNDSTGKTRIVDVKPFRDLYGIDWITVIILSETVELQSIHDSNKISLIISSSAIVAVVIIALLLGYSITRPLSLISSQMKRIANMDMGRVKKIRYMKLYEIDEIVGSLHNMASGLRSFEQYVPSDVVRALVQQKKTAKLGVVPRQLTIMFVQLMSTVKFFDEVEPIVVIQVLQDYFTALSDLILEHSGVIDKYMGESIMALFNAPLTVQDHAAKAVSAANAMHAKMSELNERSNCKNYPTLHIIIGINSAKSLVGNIGSHDRVSYTALGDGVNVASRLNSLNNRYKTETIIGPETYESVKLIVACRWLTRVCVKGKRKALDIYAVLSDLDKATDEQKLICSLSLDVKTAIESNELNEAEQVVSELLRLKTNDVAGQELQTRLNQD